MKCFEDVRGTVIGPFLRRVWLIAPNGNRQREGHIDPANETAKEWGEVKLQEIRDSKCGDGKPISEHPRLLELIYGKGKWEVREEL